MDNITYELIFEYLCDNNKKSSNFPNKRNLIVYGNDFPDKFAKLFGKNYYRYGVNSYDINQENISLYSSILTILDKEFISLNIAEQQKKVRKFITFLLDKLPPNYSESHFKSLSISKETIKENIRKMDWLIMQLVVTILKINILIFDFVAEERLILYQGEFCNPWQPFIFLAKKDEYYEPILSEKKNLYSFNDNFLKKLLRKKINYFGKKHLQRDYVLVDNYDEIYDRTINSYIPELDRKDLNKNKKAELMEMILKLDPSMKLKKTIRKNELIDIYIEKFNQNPQTQLQNITI